MEEGGVVVKTLGGRRAVVAALVHPLLSPSAAGIAVGGVF